MENMKIWKEIYHVVYDSHCQISWKVTLKELSETVLKD